ncbi:RND efflux membrane fusion protein [Klebsiella grimontii]|uniref:RND efflux membrane fusion protein n=1 Tax=Klebsiella grimontii TaxID=2058152 RepID=A0A7H4P0B7_9ENTR|nr:RND efflux membrane fusion protein [Klebsiella grimontii]
MKGSNKSRWAAVLVVAIIAGAAYWFWQGREAANAPSATAAGPGPGGGRAGRFGAALAPVQAATAASEAVPRYLSGLGTVTAANTVTVRSRVDGQLLAIHFTEGQQVKAGDLLAEIDPSQFKVALAQAEGQLAKDRATLANARRDLARYQQLVKNQSGFPSGAGYPAVAGQRNPGHDQSGRSRRRQRPAAAELEPHHRADRRPGRLKAGGYRQPNLQR